MSYVHVYAFCKAVCVVKWYIKMILRFSFFFLIYKDLYLIGQLLSVFLRNLKLYPTVFLFTPGFYTSIHKFIKPSCDCFSLGLNYLLHFSEWGYICEGVSIQSGQAFLFPIMFMITYFWYIHLPAFTFPFSMVVFTSYQNYHSTACHFIFEFVQTECKLFLLVQSTNSHALPCVSHSAGITLLHCPLKFRRVNSEKRMTLEEQEDANMIENLVDIVWLSTWNFSENCELAL